jgi:hypothetical protein
MKKDLQRFLVEQKAESQANYEQRVLKKILTQLGDDEYARRTMRTARDDFGCMWINTELGLPVSIYAQREAETQLRPLISGNGITKTKMWKAFFGIKSMESSRPSALIFPISKVGQYVIHDMKMEPVCGFNTIIRPGLKGNPLMIMHIDAFIKGLGERWSP